MDSEDAEAPRESPIKLPPGVVHPIPAELHSVYESGPFSACTICSTPLASCGLYEIQKVMKGRECVFEMAICHRCGDNLAREFSQESLEAMKGFLLGKFRPAPTPRPQHCHFCGFPKSLAPGYVLAAACQGQALVMPEIVMCETCGERLSSKLSRKTRDVQGDFVRDNFPGVPADPELHPCFGSIR